ncbi:MAG: AAC(3) family N-acetyltransferase [Pseudomonadota bacterium]|nr:AAC(3) family N-acetyltransferase [Pseudomonadota bacterium]
MRASPDQNLAALKANLDALGLHPGMDLAVHSRLLSFGRIPGGVETVYQALRDAVGPGGTLIFPTYTLPLTSETLYDAATTPSHGMGALSEYARQRPDAVRTDCPMHGHCAIGPKAPGLLNCDPLLSLGPGASFDWMLAEGFHLLLLGCTAQEGATYMHHVEAMVGVPYRSWIDVPRRILRSGTVTDVQCRYYGRARNSRVKNDLSRAEAALKDHPDCVVAPIDASRDSLRAPLAAVDETVRELLRQDPYALTRQEATP